MYRNLRHELEDIKQGPMAQEESCVELLNFATRAVSKMRGKEIYAVHLPPEEKEDERKSSSSSSSSSEDSRDSDEDSESHKHRALYKAAVRFEREVETLLESIKDCKKRFHKKLKRHGKEQ